MPSNVSQISPTGKMSFAFAVESKSVKQEETTEGTFGTFIGYASTFGNVDKHDDIVARGAFSNTIKGRDRVKMLWQHDMWDLIGTFIEFKEDDFGLLVTGRINLGTQRGKDAFALVKAGDLDTMSIGYRVLEFSIDRKTGVRILEELELMEISLVTIPANDMAQVTAVKSFVASELLPIMTDEEVKGELETLSENSDEKRLKPLFLYRNEKKYAVLIGAYVGNEAKAHPEWVKKADKELDKLDISNQEKALIRQTLSKYYKEMGEDCPWEAKSLDKIETITDVDDYLKDKGLSNKEAKKLISKIKEFCRDRDDVDEKAKLKERDVVDCKAILDELTNINNSIKGGHHA